MTLKTTGNEAKVIPVHPFFEYDLNGNNYDQNITIFYPKVRLKYDWYVKIETINMTFRIHEKN